MGSDNTDGTQQKSSWKNAIWNFSQAPLVQIGASLLITAVMRHSMAKMTPYMQKMMTPYMQKMMTPYMQKIITSSEIFQIVGVNVSCPIMQFGLNRLFLKNDGFAVAGPSVALLFEHVLPILKENINEILN